MENNNSSEKVIMLYVFCIVMLIACICLWIIDGAVFSVYLMALMIVCDKFRGKVEDGMDKSACCWVLFGISLLTTVVFVLLNSPLAVIELIISAMFLYYALKWR